MKKTILITGASSGFGHTTAKLFQQEGWNVIATMRSPEKEQELNQLPNVLVTYLDVQNQASITQSIDEGLRKFDSIDVLVNNAGYGLMGVFESSTSAQIQQQFQINVFGMMNVTRAVLPQMRKQKSGSIINLSSFAGQVGMPFGAPYISSKFAVEGFSESLSHELHPFNIFVKVVEPGSVSTNFGNSRQMIENGITAYDPMLNSFFSHLGVLFAKLPKASKDEVAHTIFSAATDGSDRFRYTIGGDGEFFINDKYHGSPNHFSPLMRNFMQG